MAAKKKPSAAQLAARAKFVAMVRAKSKAKKSATKKAATKKASTHKDTKSHNVNIRVVSGTKKKSVAKKKVSGLDKVVRRGTKTNVHYSRISGIGLNDIGLELLDLERKIIGLKSKKKFLKSVKDKKEIQGKITIYNNQFKHLKGYLNTRAKFI
jgi:hypothetical protein